MEKAPEAASYEGKAPFYSFVELSQRKSMQFDRDGEEVTVDEPETFFRARLGLLVYNERLDMHATFSVLKNPHTQQVLSRRPEISVAALWLKTPNYFLRQYNHFLMPYSEPEEGFKEQSLDGSVDPMYQKEGTVYIMGLNPALTYFLGAKESLFELGIDGRTYFFSQRQTQMADSGFEFEDYVAPLDFKQYLKASYIVPSWAKLKLKAEIVYTSKFRPVYFLQEENLRPPYRYEAQRTSYYSLGSSYKFDEHLSLTNDFYHFHAGFFQAQKYRQNRRFLNVVTLAFQL